MTVVRKSEVLVHNFNMLDYKIVFIHGHTASHLADWYPNISKELDKFGIDYVIPDLPGGEYPHAKEWLDVLHDVITKITKPLILVGHSLGTRTALLYLEKYQQKAEKAFLIAAFRNDVIENVRRDRKDKYGDFFSHKIDIDRIRPLAGKFIVIHSKDDSSIPYQQGVEIADDLDAKLITYEGRDHLFEPENAPFVFSELRRELDF